jgi:hypothetical protein
MYELMETKAPSMREIQDVLNELEREILSHRNEQNAESLTIKDLRRIFDQESAKMNQAIFNDQNDQVRESCLKAIIPLIEILSRT